MTIAARLSNFAITAGINQMYSPQRYWTAEVTKIGERAPNVPKRGKKMN